MLIALFLALGLGALPPAHAASTLVRDGSLGAGPVTALRPAGTIVRDGTSYRRHTIPEGYGLRVGSNLFHSFATFRVGTGDAAVFTLAGPTSNVVSRVTGGSASVFQGLLAIEPGSSGGAPAFFLVNPAGITFAGGAAIDVPGAFHATTADQLRLRDGVVHVDPGRASSFTSAEPAAFGFLAGHAGRIAVGGGVRLATAGRALSLAAAGVTLHGGTLATDGGGGDVRLAATGGQAAGVPLAGELPALAGPVVLRNGALVITDSGPAASAGNVAISGGSVTVDGAGSDFTGVDTSSRRGSPGGGGHVRIRATGAFRITNGATIDTGTRSAGPAGDIDVSAASVAIGGGSPDASLTGLFSEALAGRGDGGHIRIVTPGALRIGNAAQLTTSTSSAGDAGVVEATAGRILIDGHDRLDVVSGAFSQGRPGSSGRAGEVRLRAGGRVDVVREALLNVAARSSGDGGEVRVDAGAVSVRQGGFIMARSFAGGAGGLVDVRAGDITLQSVDDRITGISTSAADAGRAGSVRLAGSGTLRVLDGAQVTAGTSGPGNGGTIRVRARDLVMDDRREAPQRSTAIAAGSDHADAGKAGSVDIRVTGRMTMGRASQVHAVTRSPAGAGNVTVVAGDLLLDGRGFGDIVTSISSSTFEQGGPAGNVAVRASRSLTIRGGGQVVSETDTGAPAGVVTARARDILLDGGSDLASATIRSDARDAATGNAGRVEVTATRTLRLRQGGAISSDTVGRGHAGEVVVSAAALRIDGVSDDAFPTGITSDSLGRGEAGSIRVAAAGRLTILRGGIISSNARSRGNAGDVAVRASHLSIDGVRDSAPFTGIASDADTGTGHGGTVRVDVPGEIALVRGGNISSTTFSRGNAGSVLVNAGSIRMAGHEFNSVTGILSAAEPGSTGRGGDVTVHARDVLAMEDAAISTDASGLGSAGNVAVRAGSLRVLPGAYVSSDTAGPGHAGSARVEAGDILIDRGNARVPTGISSKALAGSHGNAGLVQVAAMHLLAVRRGGAISSSTSGGGHAGSVTVDAGEIVVDGGLETTAFTGIASASDPGASGRAGSVAVRAAGRLAVLRGGAIQSSTSTAGNAGSVTVRAADIELHGDGVAGLPTGILSDSRPGAGGDAGPVDVAAAGALVLRRGGVVSSTTFSHGNAGSVVVQAGDILVARETPGAPPTAIRSASEAGGGHGGSVEVTATRGLALLQGGLVTSSTASGGNAGSIVVRAADVAIDGQGIPGLATGIQNDSRPGGIGHAGPVRVTATGTLALRRGGVVSSSTFTPGQAGSIAVAAGEVVIDRESAAHPFTGIATNSEAGGGGPAGSVEVQAARRVALLHGGRISSDTASAGDAGSVTVRAPDLLVDGGALRDAGTGISSESTRLASGQGGRVEVTVPGTLDLRAGGAISSGTFGTGHAGSVRVDAGDLVLEGGRIASESGRGAGGRGGRVEVNATGTLRLLAGGTISSGTFSPGDAGSILVAASGMLVDGGGDPRVFTGVASTSEAGGGGRAGAVRVDVAGELVLARGGQVSSGTFTAGDAGSVDVTAATLVLKGDPAGRATGMLVEAGPASSGRAGDLRVNTGQLVATDGARISSDSRGSGHAGSVTLAADSIHLASGSFVSSRTFDAGDAGTTRVTAGRLSIDGGGAGSATTGISSEAREGSRGQAGSVDVTVQGTLAVLDRGVVSTSTFGAGDAGSVVVRAATVSLGRAGAGAAALIASQAAPGSSGAAGNVQVSASEGVFLRGGGSVASSTFGQGAAGSVELSAPRVQIDGEGTALVTGIFSQAEAGSAGPAGSVRVNAPQELLLTHEGRISSSTFARGAGGSVAIDTGTLRLAGALIAAQAGAESTGQTGNVTIAASRSIELLDRGRISIQNDATVADRTALRDAILRVTAPELRMTDAAITAASSGNVAASSVDVRYTGALRMQSASITTTANQGDGGAIRVLGGRTLDMADAQVSTSVAGRQGNGGDIEVRAGTLLMRTAFIQANTAAADATGGNVLIDAGVLIPSGSSLLVGGTVAHAFRPGVFGFNLIQAAAPTGLSGTIAITSPALDIAGALAGLNASAIDPVALAGSPCHAGAGSALVRAPRGALPGSQRDLLVPAPTRAGAGAQAAPQDHVAVRRAGSPC